MPSIPLHPRPASNTNTNVNNSLPHLLQTPSGLAILELQGTINIPTATDEDTNPESDGNGFSLQKAFETSIGKIVFPDYSPQNSNDKKWMKRVYLYVGRYQRMAGEVKELVNPLAVIRKRAAGVVGTGAGASTKGKEDEKDELEIVDIVKYKLLFANRPEPANDG